MQRLTRLLGQVVLGLRDGLPIPRPLLPRGISYPHFQRKTLCHPSRQGTPSSLSKPGGSALRLKCPSLRTQLPHWPPHRRALGSDTEPPRWGWPQGAASQLSVGKTQLVRKRGLLHVQTLDTKVVSAECSLPSKDTGGKRGNNPVGSKEGSGHPPSSPRRSPGPARGHTGTWPPGEVACSTCPSVPNACPRLSAVSLRYRHVTRNCTSPCLSPQRTHVRNRCGHFQ